MKASGASGTGQTECIPMHQLPVNSSVSQAQSCQAASTSPSLSSPSPSPSASPVAPPLPPTASTTGPHTQPFSSVSALTPLPPTASTIGPYTQPFSSVSALTPLPSTSPPPVPPRSPSPASTSSSTTPPVLKARARPPTSASIPSQPPTTGVASTSGDLQTQPPSPVSASTPPQPPLAGSLAQPPLHQPVTTPRSKARRIFGNVVTIATIVLGIVAVYYGAVMFPYTKWTQHNDFRDGCINDRDHNLPMAKECSEELARARVSSVVFKRDLGAVRNALTPRLVPEPQIDDTIHLVLYYISSGLLAIQVLVGLLQLRSILKTRRDTEDITLVRHEILSSTRSKPKSASSTSRSILETGWNYDSHADALTARDRWTSH